MNFGELQAKLAFVLDNNDGQVNQGFSDTRIKQALNYAYRDELRKAQLECGRDWLKTTTQLTWPASQVHLVLPKHVAFHSIVGFQDVTEQNTNSFMFVGDEESSGSLFWFDRNTLQWGVQGPSSERTLRVTLYPNPSELVNDADEPELIPALYHDLLVWTAAVFLTEVGDQQAPLSWMRNRDDMRMDMQKMLSRGRPLTRPPQVWNPDPDPAGGTGEFGLHDAPGNGLNNVG